MATYRHTCIDETSGRELSGTLEAETSEEAIAALRSRGLHPIQLEPAAATPQGSSGPSGGKDTRFRRAGAATGRGRLRRKDLPRVTRQLASLLKAGLPLLRALEVLARQGGRSAAGEAMGALADAVRGGAALSEAMTAQPASFPKMYVAMVRAGEAGGVLEVVLERLGGFLEKSARLRARVQTAMIYPAMIGLVAGGVVTALMLFVVPKFEAVFASLLKGQPLPGLTAGVLAVGRFLQDHALAVGALPVVAGFGVWCLLRNTAVRRVRDRALLATPGFGGLATKAAVARFARTLGTLLAAGVPILAALRITRETGDNLRIADVLAIVHDRIEAGESFARPLAAARVFPELVPSMIEVGEETGALPEMLGRIADTYEEEVDTAVAGLTALIEPLTIATMAVVVGTIVIAMFLPIVRIIQTLA